MSDFNSMLEDIAEKTAVLKENKVAKTAYTDTAYADDDAAGVSSYEYAQEQNIPNIASIDTNDKILTKGFRSQSASIPRMYLNHMFGRISYNLNKAVDFLNTIATAVIELNRLGGKYSPTTKYRQFDTCSYPIAVGATTRLMRFIRVSDSPEILTGVPPVNVGGDINVNWSDAYSYKANLVSPAFSGYPTAPTPDEDDNTNKIATTSFVQAISSSIATALALKANTNSPVFTGSPEAPTPATGDNSNKLATTSFVASASNAGAPILSRVRISVFSTPGEASWTKNEGENFAVVYVFGASGPSGTGAGDLKGGGDGGGAGGFLVLRADLTNIETIPFTIGSGGVFTTNTRARGTDGEDTTIGGVVVHGGESGMGGDEPNQHWSHGGTVDTALVSPGYEVLVALTGGRGGNGLKDGTRSGAGGSILGDSVNDISSAGVFGPLDHGLNPSLFFPLAHKAPDGSTSNASAQPTPQPIFVQNNTQKIAVGGPSGGPANASTSIRYGKNGTPGAIVFVTFR